MSPIVRTKSTTKTKHTDTALISNFWRYTQKWPFSPFLTCKESEVYNKASYCKAVALSALKIRSYTNPDLNNELVNRSKIGNFARYYVNRSRIQSSIQEIYFGSVVHYLHCFFAISQCLLSNSLITVFPSRIRRDFIGKI
jgi:hypothetical protein